MPIGVADGMVFVVAEDVPPEEVIYQLSVCPVSEFKAAGVMPWQ